MSRGVLVRTAALLAALLAAAPVGAAELLVSAAASLTDAVGAAAAAFAAEHPGDAAVCNFAGSGTLLRQLERGAPVDLLLAADPATVDRAAAAGLVRPATRRVFAGNSLVLVAPRTGAATHLGPDDLARRDGLLVAVGNPGYVPAGRYTRQALGPARWAALEGRLVLGNSVRQVLDYVARGEVDAGVVYATDAAAATDRVRTAATLTGHLPVRYPGVVTAASGHPALAERFLAFLCGPRGQEILARHGFETTPETAVRGTAVVRARVEETEWTSR